MNINVGADPELFVCDARGKFISAIGMIGGTKEKPRKIRKDGCAVQEDNVACEFNIPPANEVDKFIESINFNLDYLTKVVAKKGLSLSITASAEFDLDQLKHPKAMEFGCEPDFNCWTMTYNPKPSSINRQLRSSGGHVHCEIDKPPFLFARYLDLFLGIPSITLDEDTRRRELYGKAGACRPKSYGVEYRTLSNFWLKSDELKAWVFNQVQRAHQFMIDLKFDGLDHEEKRFQHCINTSDKGLMKNIMAEYGI
ncbi:MAG: hypothetical protein NUV80_06560 [Candidatus Berkelbacteria bacterium]|nr:hypothetical protein [Candidatus Berkelbacteria bacterium]